MSKKRYFVLSPTKTYEETKSKAANYYGSKDYECFFDDTSAFSEFMKQMVPYKDDSIANAKLLAIGVETTAMAQCDSVYVSKDWESDDICKFCHALAFSHGLDMVYESV